MAKPAQTPAPGLGELLRTYRRRAMVTQEELAARSGLSVRTVRRLEQGAARLPRASTLRLLAAQLALDPDEVTDLLRSAPDGPSADPGPRPAPWAGSRLPDDLVDFTGRVDTVHRLTDLLRGGGGEAGPRRLVQVSGAAGVGKTAVAVHVAHRLRPEFADGCLYLDLRGRQDQPLRTAEAISQLLVRCLAEDTELPNDAEERRALLAATLAGRRLLLVLDNVDDEAQVGPLLSAAPEVSVLLTARRILAAVHNLRHHDLGLFDPDEAVALLRSVVGSERVAAEPAEAGRVAELCGRLPLAVRIAAARLVSRPHWTLRRLAEQLSDEHRRLETLTLGDWAVRASIAVGHRSLGASAGTLFHRLGTATDTDLPRWVAGPLLDLPPAEAEEALEELVESRLVEVGGPGSTRYAMHALVRLYARELPPADPARLRPAAERLVGGWLALAETAAHRLAGGPPRLPAGGGLRYGLPATVAEQVAAHPRAWFEREQQGLVSAIHLAGRLGLDEQLWDLMGCFGRYLELVGDLDRWQHLLRYALDSVRRAGNRRGEAHLLRGLGEVLIDRDEHRAAREHLTGALAAFTELGDDDAVADVERALGYLERMAGDLTGAAVRLEAAVRYFSAGDDLVRRGDAYYSLGLLRQDQGRFPEALVLFGQALAVETQLGNRVNQALLRCSMGSVLLMQDRVEAARTVLLQGLADAREADHSEAYALAFLGAVGARTREFEAADRQLGRALASFRRSGDRHGEALALRFVAELRRGQGRLDEADAAARASLRLWSEIQAPVQHARSLVTLGRVQRSRDDPDAARVTWERADAGFRGCGSVERAPSAVDP